MFSWLKNLFTGRQGRYDLYRPAERQIYKFWDGKKEVADDPMLLYKRMMDVGPELSINIKVANSPLKDAGEAHTKMLEQIRNIFRVAPLAAGGLTEYETVGLLDHFLLYCAELKKNLRSFATLPGSLAAASANSSAASPPTEKPSESGSTANAPSTAGPPPSPSEPESPSA